MDDGLRKARRRMQQIRFAGDAPAAGEEGGGFIEAAKDFHLVNELNISQAVTPLLRENLDAAMENLAVPFAAAEAFVYASAEIQAGCYADNNGCVIRFSSALVDILDADEFKFVAGHELGHFLFGHKPEKEKNAPMHFMRRRAREISSDRAGLVACGGSLNTAIKAMMKMISGLTAEHLRFNVGAFLSQLKKSSGSPASGDSTHPPVVVRCRALHWFSLSGYFDGDAGDFSAEQSQKLDERVQKDLARYVDGRVGKWVADAKENVRMWTAIRDIVRDGKFDMEEQRQFAENFGRDKLQKLKGFLGGMPSSEIKNAAARKLAEAQEKLQELISEKRGATAQKR